MSPQTVAVLDDLLAANVRYAEAFDAGHLPREPARRLVVITCMDARINPAAALGLRPGDAHVLRNAGGRVSDDVIRSLVVSTGLLGVTTVIVMHHTGCGMAAISKRDVQAVLSDISEEHWEAFDLLAIEDQHQALREDVDAVLQSRLLPPLQVTGLIYDVATGRVQQML
ncbi:MAG: carbonic anhydrase [Nitriliruptorales bacterium]|nr:carbonic anhydrase [Nitriliruptorales bacterium]